MSNASEAAKENKSIGPVQQNVYEFLREDGEKPDLTEESRLLITLNGVVMDLDLEKLFWGYGKFPYPKVDINDADIKGYSLLEKCYNPETGELALDKKKIKFSIFDPTSGQFFKIHNVRLSWCAWFDDNEFTDADATKFGDIIYGAKKMNQKKVEEIVKNAEEAQAAKNAPLVVQEEPKTQSYNEYRDEQLANGYKEFRSGKIVLFDHENHPEEVIRLNDKDGNSWEELQLLEVWYEPTEGKIIHFTFQDGEEKYTILLDEEKQSIKIKPYIVKPKKATEGRQEEEGSSDDNVNKEEGSTEEGNNDDKGSSNEDEGGSVGKEGSIEGDSAEEGAEESGVK